MPVDVATLTFGTSLVGTVHGFTVPLILVADTEGAFDAVECVAAGGLLPVTSLN